MQGRRAALLAALVVTAVATAGCFGTYEGSSGGSRSGASGSGEAMAEAFAAFFLFLMWIAVVAVVLMLVVALLMVGLGTVALTAHGVKARAAGAMLMVLGLYIFMAGVSGVAFEVGLLGAVAVAVGLVPWLHYLKERDAADGTPPGPGAAPARPEAEPAEAPRGDPPVG